MNISNLMAATGLAILALGATGTSFADSRAEIDSNVVATLSAFNALNPANEGLRKKAAGMLVFPSVTKGGVGIAGEFGEGVLQVAGKTVGYYTTSAGSVGLTLGLAKRSEIIMFMTKSSLDKFRNSKGWSIAADAGVTVMKTGASGEYDSKTEGKPILAFAFAEKGLIGDLSLEGSKITRVEK